MTSKRTIENLRGETEYVSLPAPIYTNGGRFREDIGTGEMLTAIWYGPRTRRMFIETDSIWEDRKTHGCVGTTIREIELEQFLRICNKFGVAIPESVEAVAA